MPGSNGRLTRQIRHGRSENRGWTHRIAAPRPALADDGARRGVLHAEARPLRPALDDAFISFRYAYNLAEGRGLVYNEGERVEGSTNLLWTLLVAAGIRLGFEAPEAAHVLDLAAGVAALLAAFAFARAGLPGSRAWVAGLALHGTFVAFETRRWLGGVAVAGLVLSFSIYVFGGPVAALRAPFPTARSE